ncbi:MAG: radical SAM family heme chaperone HemW [Candidatus Krumholzibacteriota bacterium]|nr:radical SAM family heme chaperone HemW [Candidatus Krumholzibacteriota bacterium]
MKTEPEAGLYLHVPFCEKKCPYCDFYSVASVDETAFSKWVNAVSAEALRYKDFPALFKTLYLGGGTPSLLTDAALEEVMINLRGTFNLENLDEITIELNPEDITEGKLRTYKRLGFNRVSLGVQSFIDEELEMLGRRHDSETSIRAIEMIRGAGFRNLSIDLISSLPGQSVCACRASLERAVALKPEHISCYQLTIKPDTVFGKLLSSGRLKEAPEDIGEEIFIRTTEFLSDNGYSQYEVSSFSGGNGRISRHNSMYWEHLPYLGLGPSAHSFDGEKRWSNVNSVESYCKEVLNNRTPVSDLEVLSEKDLSLEALFLGLRTIKGVSLDVLKRYDGWEDASSRLSSLSLVKVIGGRMIPTLKGLLFADRLPLFFIG